MNRRLMLALLSLAVPTVLAAQEEQKVAVVFPTMIGKGPVQNGPTLAAAIRESLSKHGYTVVSGEKADAAIKDLKLDLSKAQNTRSLGALRDAVGAQLVVYPRLLSVGSQPGASEQQFTVLVNVQGKSNSSFVHTRQLSQPFSPRNADDLILPRADLDLAAAKLLEGFYAKTK